MASGAQVSLPHVQTAEQHHERLDAFEVWRTPLPVARQGVQALADFNPEFSPGLALDVGAGCGPFGAAVHDVFGGGVCIQAVEPREEETKSLRGRKVYEAIHQVRFEDFEAAPCFDLIVANPAFTLWPDVWARSIRLLSSGGCLLLYLPSTMGHSDEPAEQAGIFDEHPPVAQFRVRGRVRHRVGRNPKTGKLYGSDNRKHSFWLWSAEPPPRSIAPVWIAKNLPQLPKGSLSYQPPSAR